MIDYEKYPEAETGLLLLTPSAEFARVLACGLRWIGEGVNRWDWLVVLDVVRTSGKEIDGSVLDLGQGSPQSSRFV